MTKTFEALKSKVSVPQEGTCQLTNYWLYLGYLEALNDPMIARGKACASLFDHAGTYLYDEDRVAGSMRGKFVPNEQCPDGATLNFANGVVGSFGGRGFWTNSDHFAPGYATFLKKGIGGVLADIERSKIVHKDEEKRVKFLTAAGEAMEAFGRMIRRYGDAAIEKANGCGDETRRADFLEMARICYKLEREAPSTFREALQLVWLVQVAFWLEQRYAMAFGRMDQYLYPYLEADLKAGRITPEEAVDLLQHTLIKIGEYRLYGGDDVINIAIGGVKRDGTGGVNALSYMILEAVHRCNIPGPNLSARLYKDVPAEFIDACLQVIGTGLGYPALMNDEVNVPALHKYGYTLEDSRDYCMVGCIENFMQGKQPPWSDGRFNTPKYLELALNRGKCMQTGAQMGPDTGDPADFKTMDDLLAATVAQMQVGAALYMSNWLNENDRYNRERYTQPFLSCFCDCCIERGLDINDGGALYPSVHGAGSMATGTVTDSLAAIEKLVFIDKSVSMTTLCDALRADFVGYEDVQKLCLAAPKFGNDNDFVDKYAVWYVKTVHDLFAEYRTPDGGGIYIGMASNTQNISAGRETAATADGRKNGAPLSDASSPTYGRDVNGPTATLSSMAKPDYTDVALGSVLNQKYSPSMFSDPDNRRKLAQLVRTYFILGGQEMQVNAVSRDVLKDAIDHPESYENLVVRVSGFSAYYTRLCREIQDDILSRTEQG